MGQCFSNPEDTIQQQRQPRRKISLRISTSKRGKRFVDRHRPTEPQRREETSEGVRERDDARTISQYDSGGHGTSATREEAIPSPERESHAITTPIEATGREVLSQAPEPLMPQDEQEHDDQEDEEEEKEESHSENPDPSPDDYPEDFDKELFRDRLKQLLETEMEVKDQEFPEFRKVRGSKGIDDRFEKKRVTPDTMDRVDIPSKMPVESEQVTPLPGEASTSGVSFDQLEFTPIQDISDTEIHKLRQLGSGGSGCVHLAKWHGVDVAMKEFYHSDPREKDRALHQETKTLSMLKHPSVVTLFGVCRGANVHGIVIEYVIGGSLKAQLRKMRREPGRQSTLDMRAKVLIALQAAHAMEYLHSRNIIHFDVKAENFLCDLRDLSRPVVKVADVGLSKHKIASFVTGSMRGTLPWMAPELFPAMPRRNTPNQPYEQPRVSDKVDVYSFAIVLWEIWSLGAEPYPDMSAADVLYRMLEGSLRPTIAKDCHPEWMDLMVSCWDPQPTRRPPFSVIAYKLECMLRA